MEIALRWWEGQFYCEFVDDCGGWMLRIFRDGELVWQQPVRSASAAWRYARDLAGSLMVQRER